MPKKTAHLISHTHWDREWYMPYENHHVRLITLMDTLLDTLKADPEFRSFHLDGQTIILDDYLQIRPERREELMARIKEGRIQIGPWYILQDEFLTSSEANVRNLQYGHKDVAATGAEVCKIGYFPDSFGNMGQAPQLMRQAGIDNAIFGRGVKPTGANNEVGDSLNYESPYSEMQWESPDGSSVLGILFANWYHNGMEVPTEPEAVEEFWKRKLADAERYASTDHLLFMNGCDHQPIQTDLSAALEQSRKQFPDVEFKHTDFPSYIQAVKDSLSAPLTTIKGELRSQRTNGWFTLVNTASSRIPTIKQWNQRVQSMLEKVAEPAAAFASLAGAQAYPHHLMEYAWKTLMQNHPHDSICGCSVDEVHEEMMTRFKKSYRMAEAVATDSFKAIAARIGTSSATGGAAGAVPFVVFNTSGWTRTGTVVVEVEVSKTTLGYEKKDQIIAELRALSVDGGIVGPGGKPVAASIEDLGVRFGYELPGDRFRQPYYARVIRVTLQAKDVPALGYATYAFVPGLQGIAIEAVAAGAGDAPSLENEFLLATIAANGSLELTDKRTGAVYRDLLVFEDTGDIGNEYMYKQAQGEALTTRDSVADIRLVERSSLRTVYEIAHRWELPASADEKLAVEREEMVNFPDRTAGRSKELVEALIVTRVTLESGASALQVSTTFDNRHEDHRLRVLFPTDVEASVHRADSIFEHAVRNTVPEAEWANPDHSHHQQAFVDVSGDRGGLTIANFGLPEYEVLRDGRNTIALTLLRSSGELGDWGVFPTPEAQCLGRHTFEYAIVPHAGGSDRLNAAVQAYQFQIPWSSVQTEARQGELPASHGFLGWKGEGIAFSSVKCEAGSGDIVARWFNMDLSPTTLSAKLTGADAAWSRSNVLEEKLEDLSGSEGAVEVRAAEILTLRASVRG